MAAYRRVDDLGPTVTCRLTACTPGSAPGPTLGVEYGKHLPFLPLAYLKRQVQSSRKYVLPILCVAVTGFALDDNAIRDVLPVLWMTSRLPVIGLAKARPVGQILKVTQQGEARIPYSG